MNISGKIKIIYEDNHLLVVEKPVNMLTQGDQTGDDDLLTALKEDIKVRYSKPGNVYLGLVHRLDRPVGGAMVFAKTSKAASRLSEQIRTREFDKSYMAVIHGVPEKLSDTLVHYLVKDERTNTVRIVPNPESADHPDLSHPSRSSGSAGRADTAKKAILDYTVKDTCEGYSLVHIRLHTGRPHQIRVQFAAIGHPLYGDQKYGPSANKPGMQLALWSVEVGFIHPVLKEQVSFSSTPPSIYPWNLFE